MKQKRSLILLTLTAFLLLASLSEAAMTIWFKDGSSKMVNKIVFAGNSADLYLTNGTTMSVPVSTIDLEGSGIGQPVGTYGGTAAGTPGGAPAAAPPPPGDQPELKAKYESASQSAVADRDYGAIQKGSTVRIITSSDLSYTIVYKDAKGFYHKSAIDAQTFGENFTLNQAPSTTTPLTLPQPTTTEPLIPPAVEEPAPGSENAPKHSILDDLSKQVTPPPVREERSSILVPTIVAAGIFLGGLGFAIFMNKLREKQFIAESQIPKRMKQLEMEIPEWQTEGKSRNDLIERCLRRIHSDKPRALSCSLKILKNDPKNLIVASIVRDTEQNAAQAELAYEKLNRVIDESRQLIDSVTAPAESLAPIHTSADRAGGVSAAAVPDRKFSPSPTFDIVVRPTTITICAILLFLAGLGFAALAFSHTPQGEAIRAAQGSAAVWISIVFTLVCAYGFWSMKKWAVLLYALEPAVRIYYGMPMGMIALPAIIVAFGIINFHEMTWK